MSEKAVKVELYQNMVNYRREMSFGYLQTYPLPTPSMIKGMAHNLLSLKEYQPLKISIQGSYDTVITNMQRVYKFDCAPDPVIPKNLNIKANRYNKYTEEEKEEIMSYYISKKSKFELKENLSEDQYNLLFKLMWKSYKDRRRYNNPKIVVQKKLQTVNYPANMFVDLIVNLRLILHIKFDEDRLNDELLRALKQQLVVLGRNEDIARVDKVKMVKVAKKEIEERLPLKNNIYITPEYSENLIGTHLRLPFYYESVKSFQDKRIFRFVDVVYIDKHNRSFDEFSEIFIDDDEEQQDPVCFLSIDDEKEE